MTAYHLVLVGCGAAKRDESAPAEDLYTSTYFGLKRRYAEAVGDGWAVLSAKHGVLRPDELIEPYDETIADVDVREWRARVCDEIATTVRARLPLDATPADATVTLLAGSDYTDPLRDWLAAKPYTVRYPFDHTAGIGEQMGLLSDAVDGGETA